MPISLFVNSRLVTVPEDRSVLEAARMAGVYVPALCANPALPGCARGVQPTSRVFRGPECIEGDSSIGSAEIGWAPPAGPPTPTPLPPDASWDGCGLCVVSVDGTLAPACATQAREGMVVQTASPDVIARRRERLADLLSTHPHACLTCAQADGCSRTQCSANVPEDERCCELLGTCELGRVAKSIGIPATTPRYRPRGFPALTGDPLFDFRPELCIGCLRCVRACGDLRGVGTLGFVMRGGRPVVGTVVGSTGRPAGASGWATGRRSGVGGPRGGPTPRAGTAGRASRCVRPGRSRTRCQRRAGWEGVPGLGGANRSRGARGPSSRAATPVRPGSTSLACCGTSRPESPGRPRP